VRLGVKPVFLTFLVILLIGCAAARGPLVSKIPGDRREFEIVQIDYSPRQAAAKVTFSSALGIFAFEMKPDGRKLDRLTLIIKKQHYCEGLSFQDRSGHTTDLLRVDGVQVRPEGSDLVIEIAPPAVDLLREAGRFQYVNQYR
jgi:hypothetical protein